MPSQPPVTPAEPIKLVDSTTELVEAFPEPGPNDSFHDVVIVAKSLMRSMLLQARAVAALADTPTGTAAVSNLRSMFEAHLDIRYLLHGPDRVRNAHKAVLYGFADLVEETVAFNPTADTRLLQAAINDLRASDPVAYQEFEAAWKSKGAKRGHWSGISRSAMTKALQPLPDQHLRRLYNGYSWYAHGVLAPMMDYDLRAGEHRRSSYHAPGEQSQCGPSAELIRETWSILERELRP